MKGRRVKYNGVPESITRAASLAMRRAAGCRGGEASRSWTAKRWARRLAV